MSEPATINEIGIQPPPIAGYTFIQPINRGANGIVFEYQNEATGKVVAVKVLDPQGRAKELLEQRGLTANGVYQREALGNFSQTLEGIVSCIPAQSIDGRDVLMMELLPQTLYDRMQQEKPFSLEETIRITRTAARGLRNLHTIVKVEHGDYHAGNIGLTGQGEAKLLDFGTATVGDSTRVGGGYRLTRAPERFKQEHKGVQLTSQMDIWSFGSVLYKMFTGEYVLEKELTDPTGNFKSNLADIVNPLYQNAQVWNTFIANKVENPFLPIPKPFRTLLKKCLSHEDSRIKDGEELQKEVEKAVQKYEHSKPLPRLIKWGTTAVITTILGLGVGKYLTTTGDQEQKIEYEQKLRIARLYDQGQRISGDLSELGQFGQLDALFTLFEDKKTAYAAFYNPDLIMRLIKKNGSSHWNEILIDISDADSLTYGFAFSAEDSPMDNWMMDIKPEKTEKTIQEWKDGGFDFRARCEDLVWGYRIATAGMYKQPRDFTSKLGQFEKEQSSAAWFLLRLTGENYSFIWETLKGSFQDQMKLCEGLPTGTKNELLNQEGLDSALKVLDQYHIK